MPDDASLPIHGFGAADYRTFEDVRVRLGRLTVVTGANNSGKSSLLSLLDWYPTAVKAVRRNMTRVTLEGLPPDTSPIIGIDLGRPEVTKDAEARLVNHRVIRAMPVVQEFFDSLDGTLWLRAQQDADRLTPDFADVAAQIQQGLKEIGVGADGFEGQVISRALMLDQGGLLGQVWLQDLMPKVLVSPTICTIADVRRSADAPLSDEDLWRLAQASSPDTTGRRVEEWTSTLEMILQDVFGDQVRYVVHPQERSGAFHLTIEGQDNLPLDHAGAGVREVVALSYRALTAEGASVLVIEEPENCLHPSAARRLVRSLLDRTDAQLVVSTHAAGIVNAGPDRLVFVERHGGASTVGTITGHGERYAAVRALGYQPSDLVLTPCAVWVEGPSDREYLRSWLAQHGLIDGIDFHIMFTSGTLAAHLSADPEAFDEMLIAMRTFSRRCVILADSDRSAATDELKPAVRRFQDETQDDHGLCIVTWGREVENYLEPVTVNEIRKEKGMGSISPGRFRWARILPATGNKIPKLTLARTYVERTGGAIPSRATAHVDAIAEFIRRSPEAT